QRTDPRVGARKVDLVEDQPGHRAVYEEVVPFDGGSDSARNHGAAQRRLMFDLRHRTKGDCRRSHGTLLVYRSMTFPRAFLLLVELCGHSPIGGMPRNNELVRRFELDKVAA